ncbi:acyltransferase family protein [Citrobacter braakii]|nr:acyltransferase [Citrobacter braakii]WIF78108.1 acyltransferase [Citrobacter braakii]
MATNKHKPRIDGPDILRGISALSVIVVHIIGNSGLKFPYFIEKVGGHFTACVTFFFAISAFSITYAYGDNVFSRDKFRDFYLKRIFRLAPLFYLAFIVEALTVYILYDHSPNPLATILSFSFLFSLVPTMQDSLVWAGWSLGIEWLFYIIYPFLICFVRTKKTALIAWGISCYISVEMLKIDSQYAGLYMNILNHMPFFISGILAFLMMPEMLQIKHKLGNKANFASLVVLFVVAVYLLSYFYADNNSISLYVTYSIAWFVLISVSLVGFPIFLNNVFTRFLGKASYSIYLNHSIVILLLKLTGFFTYLNQNVASGVWVFCISMFIVSTITLLISWVTYHYIEIPGMTLGKKTVTYKLTNLKHTD